MVLPLTAAIISVGALQAATDWRWDGSPVHQVRAFHLNGTILRYKVRHERSNACLT